MATTSNFEELSQKKISRLFWQYALPAIVGTIVNTLYNIIDGIFIGHWVGNEALAGLGVVLPVMILLAAVGMMVGMGSAARISIYLGLNDKQRAEEIVGTSFILTILLSGTTAIIFYLFLKPILMFMGASEITYPYARDFLNIFLTGNIFLSLCFNFNSMMRASGYPLKAMITMLITVVANIILAPIFILLLDWEMKGAAVATTISMMIGFCFVTHHFMGKNSFLRLRKKNIRLPWETVKAIISIGLSPFSMQVAASAVVILINFQLHHYASTVPGATGDYAIAAFSNANRLLMLIVMVVIGLTQGMQPIIGYNYGAQNYKRVKETLFYAIKTATYITTIGFILAVFFPTFFVKAFSSDPQVVSLSAMALRYLMLAFFIVGFQIVISTFFQCIGMPGKSILLGLSRQCIFFIPLLLILPPLFGLRGVWLSGPVADVFSAVLSVYLITQQMKIFNGKIIRQEEREVQKHGTI